MRDNYKLALPSMQLFGFEPPTLLGTGDSLASGSIAEGWKTPIPSCAPTAPPKTCRPDAIGKNYRNDTGTQSGRCTEKRLPGVQLMTASNTQTLSALGLDVGTSRIVAAQRQDKDIQFDTQLNAFVTIPFSKLTQGVLKKERIPHLVQDSEITVYGDEWSASPICSTKKRGGPCCGAC